MEKYREYTRYARIFKTSYGIRMDRINFYLSSTCVIRFIEIRVCIKVRSLIIKVTNSGFYAGKS